MNVFINKMLHLLIVCLMLTILDTTHEAIAISSEYTEVETLLYTGQIRSIREKGADVLPILAEIYENSDENTRIMIATIFYQIGKKSTEAKNVLMQDINTNNPQLRLQVQWSLGRVSNDEEVVDVLLSNMQNDPNPLFRDKSACALASDQIHLSDLQKVRLYEGLIKALSDPKPQVRNIAIKALQIQTGQTKGFNSNAAARDRESIIREWLLWLEEYKSNL